jgi:hypothetical protein
VDSEGLPVALDLMAIQASLGEDLSIVLELSPELYTEAELRMTGGD